MSSSSGRELDPRPEGPRRGRVALGTVMLLSAVLFLFSVVSIARVGADSEPSPAVVSAARAVVEKDTYARPVAWKDDAYYEARRRHKQCRKRGEHPRPRQELTQ